MTLIIATHNVEVAASCDRGLQDGQVVSDAELDSPDSQRVLDHIGRLRQTG